MLGNNLRGLGSPESKTVSKNMLRELFYPDVTVLADAQSIDEQTKLLLLL